MVLFFNLPKMGESSTIENLCSTKRLIDILQLMLHILYFAAPWKPWHINNNHSVLLPIKKVTLVHKYSPLQWHSLASIGLSINRKSACQRQFHSILYESYSRLFALFVVFIVIKLSNEYVIAITLMFVQVIFDIHINQW